MIASTQVMQTLAWSLLHFLWQGAAIAAVAATLMLVFRKPNSRYLVGLGALVSMLAAFVVTFALLSDAPARGLEFSTVNIPTTGHVPAPAPSPAVPVAQQASDVEYLWIARGWLFGVFCFALRVACGLLLLAHLRRRNLVALPDALVVRFRILQHRLGIRRVIRYCECRLLGVPAVVGFFRPVVLLPVRALTGLSVEQLEAVIAHELGHIKRFDVAVNFFQVITESLFFFHPAVWWLNKRIRADREDCCDDVAVAACGGTVGYARALATMDTWRDGCGHGGVGTGHRVDRRRCVAGSRDSRAGADSDSTSRSACATSAAAGLDGRAATRARTTRDRCARAGRGRHASARGPGGSRRQGETRQAGA